MDALSLSISLDDLIFYFSIASIIFLIFVIYKTSRRRKEDFIEAADALGFLSTPLISNDIYNGLIKFRLYHERSMLNPSPVAQKKRYGFNLSIFNVSMLWMKADRSHTVTVAHVRFHDQKFPDFLLETPTLLNIFDYDRIARRMRFKEHAKFSRYFWLEGQDEQATRAFFTPRVIAFFEQKRKAYLKFGLHLGPIGLGGRFPCLEAKGNEIIFFFESKAFAPRKLPYFINEAVQVVQVLSTD